VKLLNFKRLSNQIESNRIKVRVHRVEPHVKFSIFFVKSYIKVKYKMHSGDEDDVFISVDRFASIEPINLTTKT